MSGSITRHWVRGLPVLEPPAAGGLDDAARMEAVDALIREYAELLEERTAHHLGYPYNLDFDFGALEPLLKKKFDRITIHTN